MIFLQGSQIEATAKCAGKCKSRKNCDGFQMYDDQSCLLLEASKLLKNEDGAVLYLKNGKTQNGSIHSPIKGPHYLMRFEPNCKKKSSRIAESGFEYHTEAKKAFAFCMLESFYALSPKSQMYMQIIIMNSWLLLYRNCNFNQRK